MNLPDDLRYTEEHEWARYDEASGVATIGVTDFAQSELGDIVFLELPAVGDEVQAGDAIGTIEAVKTVADLYAPVSGEIMAVNEQLNDAPELINEAPYDAGWMVRIKLSDPEELDSLLSVEKYQSLVE